MSDQDVFLIAWCLGVQALLVLALLRDGVMARLAVAGAATMVAVLILAVLVL